MYNYEAPGTARKRHLFGKQKIKNAPILIKIGLEGFWWSLITNLNLDFQNNVVLIEYFRIGIPSHMTVTEHYDNFRKVTQDNLILEI